MNKELFNELLESIREGSAIIKGEKKPSRSFNFNPPNVTRIRKKYGLTQYKFAQMLGISIGTLRNWEQGRRTPRGPAKILLGVAEKYPKFLLNTVKTYFPENK